MPSEPIPFDRFRSELLALYAATRAKATAKKMRQALGLFDASIGPATTADMTLEALSRFAAAVAVGRHENTAATLLSYLRAACAVAVRTGALQANPFCLWPGFVRFGECRGPAVHPPGSIAKVLAHLAAASAASDAAGRLHAWAAVLAHTGLRRDEALHLRAEDLDLAGGFLHVRRRLKRPSCRRKVPMPAGLVEVMRAWLPRRPGPVVFPNRNGNPWAGGAPGYRPADRLRQAGEAAGVAGFTPSSLRHSFATACAATWQIPPATLQKLMGHTDLRTTMRYYVHLSDDHLLEAGRRIGFAPPAA